MFTMFASSDDNNDRILLTTYPAELKEPDVHD